MKPRTRARTADPIELALLRDALEGLADEIATICTQTAASPNIKERLDLSAAVFDQTGQMVAHAAHIPVHLGAMPACVRAVLEAVPLAPGQVVLVNDPLAGGTHLPDITAVRPVFAGDAGAGTRPTFILAVRAHHADVGGAAPGSMAPQANIFGEGLIIPPVVWQQDGVPHPGVQALLLANMRDGAEREADLAAQAGALHAGEVRLRELAVQHGGLEGLSRRAGALLQHAERTAAAALESRADGRAVVDVPLEVQTAMGDPASIGLTLEKRGKRLVVDFRKGRQATSGPIVDGLNAPAAVTRSAVYYFVRCLCPPGTPTNEGLLRSVEICLPDESVVSAGRGVAVAGGNVETSQRIVDALWLAAARLWPKEIPAPGGGSMSNWTFGPVVGGPGFPSYYETLPCGAGGGPDGPGASALQLHMTNTASTPVEVLEAGWPVAVVRMARRARSGGSGRHRGGDGLLREIQFLAPADVGFLMTRHTLAPPGVAGGAAGKPGRLSLVSKGRRKRLAARGRCRVEPGDVLRIETPGGGGWGRTVGTPSGRP